MAIIKTFKGVAAACVLATLVACGGGGDSTTAVTPTPGQTPDFTVSQLQGRWLTAAGITPAQTAIVVPAGSGSTDMALWLLSSDLQSLAKLQVSATGADGVLAQGKTYALGGSIGAQTANYTGTVNLTSNTLDFNSGVLQLTRADNLNATANLADVVGAWRSTAGTQAISVDWSVAANGAISASSTTGCDYSGLLAQRTDVKVFDVTLTENCAGQVVNFSGIATYRLAQDGAPAVLTLAVVNAAESAALALVLTR